MSKLPLITAKEMTKILKKLGFNFIRQEGSHMFFGHPDGRTTVIPNHPGEEIDRGLLNKIVKPNLRIISRKKCLEFKTSRTSSRAEHLLQQQQRSYPSNSSSSQRCSHHARQRANTNKKQHPSFVQDLRDSST